MKPWITLIAAVMLSPLLRSAEKPNILVIIADDCTHSDLSFHGGQNAKTPHLDAFAKQGTVFERAYLGMAMCAPSRSELYTGRLPLRNGCAWNQATSRPGTKSITHYLGDLGYRVGLAGKTHIKPRSVYPFEEVPGFDENCVRDPTLPHDLEGSRKFITRDEKQPFCLVVALTEPHAPWVMGDASQYPPRSLKLPGYLADTPLTRQSYSRYLAEVTYMDGQVGELLEMLEKTGKAKDTLVLFTSEQGAQFPGCKWTNWDLGLHTSIVARWPGVVPAGRRTPALVQYADVVPTFIEIAGGKPEPKDFDGTSFAAVLRGEKDTHREYVEGMHNNYPEGPPYPIRSISDGEWRYIRNLTPERIYIEKHLMGRTEHNPYWGTWVFSSTEKPKHLHLVERFINRPAEELYHTAQDNFEHKNLANDPAHAAVKARLSAALDRYLKDQLDPGAVLDTPEAFQAAQDLKPNFPGKE
ncbi:sulfatase [Luteolibacter flavescens]|uniref:Sulfatase n=1 Tax=Luteolibacter flavescens TaxID=1859460 RepID=A0ABT3FN09_9BACT|nr:sulfatase [Luteolibacter flavescens]MCW1884943.1 sulfatase [Luteolibacter flavescens]